MRFRDYINSLTPAEKAAFAKRAGTSLPYLQVHLLADPPGRVPRPALMQDLAAATDGHCSLLELLEHFYGEGLTSERRQQEEAGAEPV